MKTNTIPILMHQSQMRISTTRLFSGTQVEKVGNGFNSAVPILIFRFEEKYKMI
jgi:hypothetical protein